MERSPTEENRQRSSIHSLRAIADAIGELGGPELLITRRVDGYAMERPAPDGHISIIRQGLTSSEAEGWLEGARFMVSWAALQGVETELGAMREGA